jgi:methionyl aminopeptidase
MAYKKSTQEVQTILEGGKILGSILDTLSRMVAPGVSAADIDAQAEELIRDAGGVPAFKGYRVNINDPAFPSTICLCVDDEIVHGIPTKNKILKDGQLCSIDIGMRWPKKRGLYTDTAITVPVGSLSKEKQQLLSVTRAALDAGIDACQIGNTIVDIGRAIEQSVKQSGTYGIVRDLVGHGVGHAVHEEPRVPNYVDTALGQWKLEPGVVIAIEPMITLGSQQIRVDDDAWTIRTIDGSVSAHVEHTIAITQDGPVIATQRSA